MRIKPNDAIQRISRLTESPIFFMLIGIPGCGKSTFVKKLNAALEQPILVASTDDLIEQEAVRRRLTYTQAFKEVNFKQISRQMNEMVAAAIKNNAWIAWDQTNVVKSSRRKKLATIPDTYTKIGITFHVDDKVLNERLMSRAQATGKVIAQHIVENMQRNYDAVTKDEGFSYLFEIDNN